MIALLYGNLPPVIHKEPTISVPAALTVGLVMASAVVSALVAMWVLL